jgi:hypothetical protein
MKREHRNPTTRTTIADAPSVPIDPSPRPSASTNAIPVPKSALVGVHGWLWWLAWGMGVFGPVLGVLQTIGQLASQEQQYPGVVSNPLWLTFKAIIWVDIALIQGLGMIGGFMLMNRFRRSTPYVVIVLMWARSVLPPLIVGPIAQSQLPTAMTGGLTEGLLQDAIAYGMFALIWSLYLLLSRRVKNTYNGAAAAPTVTDLMKLQLEMGELMSEAGDGIDSDQFPNGSGAFGASPKNPVPCKSIVGCHVYLDRLRTAAGRRVTYHRVGSVRSPLSAWPVDAYLLTDDSGKDIGTIYLSPYQRRISERAPPGFTLAAI